jgi:hypothetical protein
VYQVTDLLAVAGPDWSVAVQPVQNCLGDYSTAAKIPTIRAMSASRETAKDMVRQGCRALR